ncbi:MAG: MBL fold metallo-hydrolase [Gammaproteobacteria bacterium]|nr:MBL fold metallo-hydrolase [Gammaproteobacteria bacterium]
MLILLNILKYLIITIVLLSVAIFAFIKLAPTFGGSPDAQSQAKIAASPNFDGNIFVNQVPTELSTPSDQSMLDSLLSLLAPPAGKNPNEPLPAITLKGVEFNNGDFAWLGHSTVIFRLDDKVVLTDPVFHNASPIAFTARPFATTATTTIEDLPPIDLVLISHDHYDHLDHRAIDKLAGKVEKFAVPLGIKGHLQRWGIKDTQIIELDWQERVNIGELEIVSTPSRHFSGRGLTNRNSTLWSSWVVKSASTSVFFSGDSGYFDGFAKIGEQEGPFDIAFMENGAYNEAWAEIHMMPEQSVQAAIDLKAKRYFPIHWSKFDLALHPWYEPALRAQAEAKRRNVTMVTPLMGEVFQLDAPPKGDWWAPYLPK